MVKVKSERTIAEVEIRVYFNLIHNILCNTLDGFENVQPLERKSAHVPMSIPEAFQGKIENPAEVYMTFANHTITFERLYALLAAHYEIPDNAEVEMTLFTTGELKSPVGTPMLLKYRAAL